MRNLTLGPFAAGLGVALRGTLLCGIAMLIMATSLTTVGMAQEADAKLSAECFERTVLGRLEGRQVACADGVTPPLAVFLNPTEYPDAFVEALLDEFGFLAVSSQNRIVRREAIGWISSLGHAEASPSLRRGIVARLARVFDASEAHLGDEGAYLVKFSIVGLAGQQAEKAEAADFLERVARAEARGTNQLPEKAIAALHGLGSEGEASLRRLGSGRGGG